MIKPSPLLMPHSYCWKDRTFYNNFIRNNTRYFRDRYITRAGYERDIKSLKNNLGIPLSELSRDI